MQAVDGMQVPILSFIISLIPSKTYMGVLVLISAQEENDLHARIFSHLDCPGFTEQKTDQTTWRFAYDVSVLRSHRTIDLARELPGAENTAMKRLVVMFPWH